MAQAGRTNSARSLFATDGKPHPLQDSLIAVAWVLGVLAVTTAFFHNLHLLTSWAGLVGILAGGSAQFLSVTTRERFLAVLGLGASGVGFFIGMAHGGLFGGVIG
ncbi:hypothetical protein [Streptomyces sp. NPDC006638]|uniref:hypothetical protein n=1 Tax=unclassified Streptomyces TaxID=2593676 RepID=UPI0033BD4683